MVQLKISSQVIERSIKNRKNKLIEKNIKENLAYKINWKELTPGVSLLAVIEEIRDLYLRLSLPNMKIGFCSIREISTFITVFIDNFSKNEEAQINNLPSLSKLLYVGEILQFVVLTRKKIKKKKIKIELTLREDIVNQHLAMEDLQKGQMIQCSIKNIEDYGYIVNIGIHGTQGFLEEKNKKRYLLGQPLYLQVKSILQNQNFIILEKCNVHQFEFVSRLNAIRSGMKVQLECIKILSNGILCNLVGSSLICTVHSDHIGEKKIMKKDVFPGRILFINYQTRIFGASLLPHIVKNYEAVLLSVLPGSFYNATCISINKMGLLLKLDDFKLNAHCRLTQLGNVNLKELKENIFKKKFCCKILSINLLDRSVQVSLKFTKISLPINTFSDIKIGMTLLGKVSKVNPKYILIELIHGIHGIISRILSRFTFLNNLTKKYKLNQIVKVIVLANKQHKIEFSDKTELINLKNKVLEYDVPINMVTKALIINIHIKGLKLLFFNKVKGFIKKEELLKLGYTENFKEAFFQGQVIDCQILTKDFSTNILICTLNIKINSILPNFPSEGSMIKVKIVNLGEQGIQVYTKKSGFRLKGLIPYYLISDHKRNAIKLRQFIKKKQILKVLILQKFHKYMLLTLKKSLIKSNQKKKMPNNFQQICKIGVETIGYIINIDKVGIFVRFLGDLTGFVRWAECIDSFGKESNFQFSVGQTVRTKIIKFDEKKYRFYLTMHISRFQITYNWLQNDWTVSCFDELMFLTNLNLNFKNINLSKFQPSRIIKTKIRQKKSFGFTASFPKKNYILGLALNPRHTETEEVLISDQKKKAIILDINETKIIDLSYRDELLLCKPLIELPNKKRQLAIIEMIREDYICLFFPVLKCLGFASLSFPNINFESRRIFRCGNIVRCKILSLHKSGRLLCIINLKKLSNQCQIKKFGTRNWEFLDKNIKCFTDLKKKNSLQAKVVLKTSFKLILELGQNIPIKGFITKTRKTVKKFCSISVGEIILVEINSTPISFSIKHLKCIFLKTKTSIRKPFMSIINTISIVGLTLENKSSFFVPLLQLSENFNELKSFLECINSKKKHKKFSIGKKVFFTTTSKYLASTIIGNKERSIETNFSVGVKIFCLVKKIIPQLGLIVELSRQNKGFIHITNLFLKKKSYPTKDFLVNDLLKVRIIGIDRKRNKITLSRRHVSNKNISDISIKNLKKNNRVSGFVKNISTKGCFLSISSNLDAYCMLCDMSNQFVKDLKKNFPIGKLVTGIVTGIDRKKKHINLSLKKKLKRSENKIKLRSISLFQTVNTIINSIQKYGVFCNIINTNLIGLLHQNNIPKKYLPIHKFYKKGKMLKLQISDLTNTKISFNHITTDFLDSSGKNFRIKESFQIKLKK